MTETCKDCGIAGFADKTGAMQHDRRSIQGTAPEGKERRASPNPNPNPNTPSAPAAPKPEKPPKRRHWLHSKWFGIVSD